MADIARLALQIDVTGARRAQQALKGLQDGSIRATRVTDQLTASTQRMATTTRRTAGAFRLQKGALQQAGFQIQDFAVQVGSGQSALVAFGQQGSQLAGILGPGGALLGAVIAIGSVVGGIFARSMMEGEESSESLRKRLLDLRDSVDELTDAQIKQVKVEFFTENRERLDQINKYRDRIKGLREEIAAYNNAGADGTQTTAGLTDPDEARKEINRLNSEIDTLFQAGGKASQELDELIHGVDKTGDSAGETAEKIREMVSGLQEQAATVGMSARETAIYEANRLGANEADREAINNAFDQIDAEQKRQEQIKETQRQEQALQKLRSELDPAGAEFTRYADQIDAIEEFNISATEKERLREEAFRQHQERMAKIAGDGTNETIKAQEQGLQVLTMSQQNALSAVGSMFGNFADIAKEGGEEQFSTWKAMASAQAAVSTALAVANALTAAPPPFNFALAASVGALGAIQLAKIQGQEYQGARAMGGQVQAGSSYLVGERGPEVVTMGGTGMVTPNHKIGGGNSANVTQVFQLSDNARREAKQQILESAPMIQQMAKQAVLQAINQGGAMSRAVGRRS